MKLVILSALLATLSVSVVHSQVRVGGSDLLAPVVSEALQEYGEVRNIPLEITFGGSYRAVERVRRGELDVVVVAIPDGGDIPGGDVRAVHLASLVVAAVVSPTNPVNQVTIRQLGGIFAEGEPSPLTRWGQLGLTGEWNVRSITTGAVTPNRHNLALDLFRHTSLQSRGLRRNVAFFEDTAAIRRRLEQDAAAIAIVPQIPEPGSGFKVLSIARDENAIAHSPTPETVASGDYALRLPLYVVFQPERAAEIRDVLRFLTSEDGTEAIVQAGLVPLPDARRQRLSFEFERL